MFRWVLATFIVATITVLSSLAPASTGSGFKLPGMRSMSATCTSPGLGTRRVEAKIVYDDYRKPNLPPISTSGRGGSGDRSW